MIQVSKKRSIFANKKKRKFYRTKPPLTKPEDFLILLFEPTANMRNNVYRKLFNLEHFRNSPGLHLHKTFEECFEV